MIDHFCHVWLDTSKGKNKRTLAECIQAAQASHQRRAGGDATVCYINAGVHPDATDTVEGVQIRRDAQVQPGHYWMAANGVEPAAEPEPEAVEEEPVDKSVIVKQPKMVSEYTCQNCGTTWTVPMAWCAECGYDGQEAA